jgi:hypothetical protein
MNSLNRGSDLIGKYKRADCVVLDEKEILCKAGMKRGEFDLLANSVRGCSSAKSISIVGGKNGVFCSFGGQRDFAIPSFGKQEVDRMGAKDAYSAVSALCLAGGFSPKWSGLMGCLAAEIYSQGIGNQQVVEKAPLLKFLNRVLK